MSLQDVLRAEKLGRSRDDAAGLAALQGQRALASVRSDAGCNLLTVYLLARWGRVFETGGPALLQASEAFQDAVVDAYVAAGCVVDEAAPARGFYEHTPPGFRHMVKLRGELSALGLVQTLLAELHPDMHPRLHEQLQRLERRLRGHLAAPAGARPQRRPKIYHGFDPRTRAVLLVGYRFQLDALARGVASLDALIDAAAGLTLEACADLENTPPDELEPVTFLYGVELFTAYGGPEQERGFTWAELSALMAAASATMAAASEAIATHFAARPAVGLHLGCCGWLASAWLLRGTWDPTLTQAQLPPCGDFTRVGQFLGTDGASQDPYPHGGVRGIRVAGASFDAGACATVELNDTVNAALDATLTSSGITRPRTFVIARYD